MRFIRTATALAIGLVLGASAMVVAGDTPQQYTGCLARDGTLSKVQAGTSPVKACAKGDTQITWNQQGPQGEQGPKGDKGDAGPLPVLIGQQVTDTLPALSANMLGTWFSQCPAGYYPASGWMQLVPGVELVSSNLSGLEWRFSFRNLSATDHVAAPGYAKVSCLTTAAPPPYTVAVTVVGGTMGNIDIRFPASDGTICGNAAACSFTYPAVASYAAVLLNNLAPFEYDCGDGITQQAILGYGTWDGQCGGPGAEGWAPSASDHTVTVTVAPVTP